MCVVLCVVCCSLSILLRRMVCVLCIKGGNNDVVIQLRCKVRVLKFSKGCIYIWREEKKKNSTASLVIY